jgi:glycosyltransferase involved in cell wall biosynthesis
MRIIARLNVGGPAHHVSILTGRLDPDRYETRLLAGHVGRGEMHFEDLETPYAVTPGFVDGLRPELDPLADARALSALVAAMRRFRPHIVHTHTAKAGALGRVAARLALGPRPIVIHTYHGHVLTGYFGRRQSAAFRGVERGLAAISDCLVGVSDATVDDLVALRVADRSRFRVIGVGLELDKFLGIRDGDGAAFRRELEVGPEDVLAVFCGRLVPIKRVGVLLEAVAAARLTGAPLRLAVVGDGELRASLQARARELGLGEAVTFCGFRTDLRSILAACDVAVLSSENEGTPVALIEAAAAARPAVCTSVGGVPDIVRPDTGLLVDAGDVVAFGMALARLAGDRELRRRMGLAARSHVAVRFGAERLVRDIEALYSDLLARRRMVVSRPGAGACGTPAPH